jgi:hypothetical protein
MAAKSVKKSMKQAARMGRGRDDTIAHLASGEVVIPLDFQRKFPAVGAALKDAFAKAGLDYERFVVGSSKNRINPRTGAPMFDDDGGDSGNGGNEAGGGWGGSELGGSGGEMGGANWGGEAPGGDPTAGGPTGGGPTDGNESYTDEYGRDMRDVYGPEYIGDRSNVTGSPGDPSTGANIFSSVLPAPDYSEFDAFSATTLPGQEKFNAVMDGFLDNVLSGVFARETTAEEVQGGLQLTSSPRETGREAEARAAEDAYNALVEDVARNEAAANALVADQAAQQAEAAAAAAQAEAAANQSTYGVLGDVGQWSWNTDKVSSGYGATGVTGAGTPGLGTGDYGVSTQGSQIASTTSTGETDEGEVASRSETLSDLPVTEVANAPNIFDITAKDNLAGRADEQDGYYSGQTAGGGGEPTDLSEEERLLISQLAYQPTTQKESIAPTVTPVNYNISRYISGIGSLATSKQA